MGFVVNFSENTIVKKFGIPANICQSYERMYSDTVFIETQYKFDERR